MIRPQKLGITIVGKSRKINMLRGRADIIRPYGRMPDNVDNPCVAEPLLSFYSAMWCI